MKIAIDDLKNLTVEKTKLGFVLWVTEEKEVDGEIRTIRHWLLDGSMVKETGEINIGNPNHWDINATHRRGHNDILITRKPKKRIRK